VLDERRRGHEEMGQLIATLAGLLSDGQAAAPVAEDDGPVIDARGLELGERVHLDEDVYAETPAHVPPRVYIFEAYDSSAPADSNCTLVDAASGDWMVRGLGELVPVDDQNDEEGAD